MAEMTMSGSAMRTQKMEESLAKIRAETIREIEEAEENFNSEMQPHFNIFRFLELVNRADHRGKARFLERYHATKNTLKHWSDKLMAGLVAMEKDVRKNHNLTEDIIARGGPFDGQYIVLRSTSLSDYID